MSMATPSLAYFVERKPVRVFVTDDFRDLRKRAEIIGPMPDYADFCLARQECRAELDSIAPELRAFYHEPLLAKNQEQHLFRQFNYFKFKFIELLDPKAAFSDKGIVTYSDVLLDADVSSLENYYKRFNAVKQQIVSCNTRLVMNIAKKQKDYWSENGGLDLLVEIMGEGNLGLVRAVDYFDFRKGYKFSTYATWVVIDSIVKAREIRGKSETTGCDSHLFEHILDDREPLTSDYSEHIAVVSKFLQKISMRQQRILKDYFERGRTLQAIADDLQVSKERVRQLRDKALQKLQKKLEQANYAP